MSTAAPMMTRRLGAFALVLALGIPACSGGSHTLPPTGRSSPGGGGPLGSLSVVIRVPAAVPTAQRVRRPAYISASTASVVLWFNGTTVGTINTTQQSPQCVANAGSGGVTCRGNFAISAGTYSYALSAFDQANGVGAKLSTANGQFVVVANQANVLHASLSGVVRSLGVSLNPSTVQQGTPATVQVSVAALDADGNVIISGSYADSAGNPVTVSLSNSDTSGNVTMSQSTVSGAMPPISLAYSGGRIPSQAITASGAERQQWRCYAHRERTGRASRR